MTQKRIQIFFIISLLIGLLGSYYWFVVLAGLKSGQPVQTLTTQTIPEIFGIKADLPSGWTQEVKESLKQETAEQETLEFKKDSFVITVNIKLTKKAPTGQVYTGYMPDMREYLTTSVDPVELGQKDKVQLARIKTEKGFSVVDQNSLVVRQGTKTYIYELPILLTKSVYETKTVITYESTNQTDISQMTNLLAEADKLVLSLNTDQS